MWFIVQCMMLKYLWWCLGDLKLKLYRDINGEIKGDGLCCYLKVRIYPLLTTTAIILSFLCVCVCV